MCLSLQLKRELTQMEFALSPYLFIKSVCLVLINNFARFDENKSYGWTDARMDNVKTVYTLQTQFVGSISTREDPCLKNGQQPIYWVALHHHIEIILTKHIMMKQRSGLTILRKPELKKPQVEPWWSPQKTSISTTSPMKALCQCCR